LLEKHINVVLFDFSGSGMSEGEYVTLGVRESQDLEDIIEVLYGEGKISDFALWGRSMGAVTGN
jgi:alpha/beta superfamily hydrolase